MRRCFACLTTVAFATGCATTGLPLAETEAAVRAATQKWITAFNTCKEPNAVADLYDPGAQLWGTVATALTSTPEGTRQYFLGPCTSMPKPTVELGSFSVRSYGDTAVSSGAYTFMIFPGGQPRSVPARFSFTFKRVGQQWLIVSHHSSPQPTPASPLQPPRQ